MTELRSRIGFVGLGQMGFPMASRLVAAGFPLAVRDSDSQRAESFLNSHPSHDAEAVELTPASTGLEALITMLPNSDVVESVLFESDLLQTLTPGAFVIDMSSSEPFRTRAVAERLSSMGFEFIDAPVSGGVKGAHAGTLSILAGGEPAVVKRASPLLEAIGNRIIHVGAVGAGHAAKALNNFVSAAGLTAVVEALHTAQRFGIDPAILTEVFNASTGRNNTTENKVNQYMLSGAFNSGFALNLMTKDLKIAMGLADRVGGPSQLGKACLAVWEEASAKSNSSTDHTALYDLLK